MEFNSEFWTTLCRWILYFASYSFAGYLIEVSQLSTRNKKITNRGFLFGPICPIYGFGAVIMLAVTEHFTINPYATYFVAVATCTSLEYATSFLMEKVFHVRYWDYTDVKFNLNGRVCLTNAFLFGIGGMVIIYITQPVLAGLVAMLPEVALYVLTAFISLIGTADFVLSTVATYNVRGLVADMKGDATARIKRAAFDYYLHHKRVISELKKRAKQKFRY